MKIYVPFVKDIMSSGIDPSSYLALACGSSLTEQKPRDTDVFIYSAGPEKLFSENLLKKLSAKDTKACLKYYKHFCFYSLKYVSGKQPYSIHIASKEKILSYIDMAAHTETYTDINIFEVELQPQTVYRKWIMETAALHGNVSIKDYFIKKINEAQNSAPYSEAEKELVSRIKNNINYFYEKVSSPGLACNVLLCQIANSLINYCYLVNRSYYGTVKYIKDDLSYFSKEPELADIAIKMLEFLNSGDMKFFSSLLNRTKDIISQEK